jgi:hypothetical protein
MHPGSIEFDKDSVAAYCPQFIDLNHCVRIVRCAPSVTDQHNNLPKTFALPLSEIFERPQFIKNAFYVKYLSQLCFDHTAKECPAAGDRTSESGRKGMDCGSANTTWTYLPLRLLPAVGDIYWCNFPDVDSNAPGEKLRPVLVRGLELNLQTQKAIVHAAYGTTTLNKPRRQWLDLIIDDPKEMLEVGLRFPTRFSLNDHDRLELIWCREFFCPPGSDNPHRVGRLNTPCQRRLNNRLFWRRE